MKGVQKFSKCVLILALGLTTSVALGEEDPIAQEETASQEVSQHPDWDSALKEKYQVTDAQISQMRSSGLTSPQLAIACQLAKESGKPLDEVLKMRTEQKMGWGKIAKELGVPPGTIGQAVASLRHDLKADKFKARQERREERRAERRENRRERREERRKEHKENKKNK